MWRRVEADRVRPADKACSVRRRLLVWAMAPLALGCSSLPVQRNLAQRRAFIKRQACPTGQRGRCDGWEIDHVKPLHCGGADEPENMQWLTIAQHRAKTRLERMNRCLTERPGARTASGFGQALGR
jgi:hypothetical protein